MPGKNVFLLSHIFSITFIAVVSCLIYWVSIKSSGNGTAGIGDKREGDIMAGIYRQQYATRDAGYLLIALIVALGVFGGAGCSVENDNLQAHANFRFAEEIVPVRYLEIKSPDLQATYHFHPNEIPALRIHSSGRVEGLLIIESETKKFVRGKKLDLSRGKLFYEPLLNLKPGDYIAYIRGKGVTHNNSCRFAVLED